MAYMPPEQWEEEEVGPPADLYAFGLILSELLAGRHGLVELEEALDEEGWYRLHKSGTPRSLRSGPAEGASQLPQEAEDLYQRLLAKRPEQRPTAAEALSMLQQVAQQLGEQPYTVPDVYPRTDERRRGIWANWAIAYARFERYEEALARNEQALALDPNDIEVLITQGNILGDMGLATVREGQEAAGRQKQEEALECYARALRAAPEGDTFHRYGLHWARGATLQEMHRFKEAETEYRESVRLMPENAVAWSNRARNALQLGMEEATVGERADARSLFQAGLSHLGQAERYAPEHPDYQALRSALQQALRSLG
jgi:tetratricopeptide (TPR) repeat protein